MIVRELLFDSSDYRASLTLRDVVLRRPLGHVLSADDRVNEDRQFHFGAFDGDDLVGCVIFKPLEDGIVKLRQMAVGLNHQRRGIGGRLIAFGEAAMVERGFRVIELSARRTAEAFYAKLGYEAVGEEYAEVGVPHVKMVKSLRGVITPE